MRRLLKQVIWARLVPYGLSPQQFWVLLVLFQKGPSSLHPLARQVWMDDPTASRVVKSMVGRGLLTTRPDPRHGRRIVIDVAPGAMPMARQLNDLAADLREAMAAGLSEAEQEALRGGLRTLIGNLESMLTAVPAQGAGEGEAVAS